MRYGHDCLEVNLGILDYMAPHLCRGCNNDADIRSPRTITRPGGEVGSYIAYKGRSARLVSFTGSSV